MHSSYDPDAVPPRAYRVSAPSPDVAEASARIEAARELVRRPSRGLTIAGWIGLVGNVSLLLYFMPHGTGAALTLPRFLYLLPVLTLGIVCVVFAMIGGASLRNGRFRGLAVAGMVLGCFPLHLGAVLAIPFSIWGFLSFGDPDVQRRFDQWR